MVFRIAGARFMEGSEVGHLEDAGALLSTIGALVRDDALQTVGGDLREALRLLPAVGDAAYTNWEPKLQSFIENLDELQAEMGAVRAELDDAGAQLLQGRGMGMG